ncbi:SIMPL domain-containing protein [Marinobacter sp.]|uniref:SIMPL domain-containing protein n=1 Tax=Marinobacter sp. TaxID=50741 RepID=UPI00384D2F19
MPRIANRFAQVTAMAIALPVAAMAGEVSLTGEGSVKYTPDSAQLQFTASAVNRDAEAATQQVNTRITQWNEAIEPLRDQLIDYTDATLNLHTRSLPVENRGEKPEQRAVASQTVSFVVRDLDLLNPLIARAQELGMEYHLNADNFFHSEEEAFQRQALGYALADARAQCKFVADEMQMSCGDVKSININSGGQPVRMMEARGARGPVSAVGPRELQVSVSATFELE